MFSIVIPGYNSSLYIKESINNVLKQSYKKFEFIIIDDGSTDNSIDIIKSYKDKRIKLISNCHNYIESLNRGIQASKGEYIARMDADDIMLPQRLKTQNADNIIVLDKGKIVEQGTHDNLVQKQSIYYKLVKNQLELGS